MHGGALLLGCGRRSWDYLSVPVARRLPFDREWERFTVRLGFNCPLWRGRLYGKNSVTRGDTVCMRGMGGGDSICLYFVVHVLPHMGV